jgi:beta-glucosidase
MIGMCRRAVCGGALAALMAGVAVAAAPCGDRSGTGEARADRTLTAMSQAEKLSLVHGLLGAPWPGKPKPDAALGSAGYVPGIPRLGIPSLQETDGPLGVANPGGVRRGDTATAMPSNIALAATWDLELARRQGESVGGEARTKGFNVLLGGASNLIRDPRGGRTFEYFSEDPLLTGLMVGEEIRGDESRGVLATIKHFALNDQENARRRLDVRIDRAAARESDLLAFEIGIERGGPGAVMCAYNSVNGDHACENSWLLNEVLKGDWGFRGFVLSDWGAVHSTERAAIAGLDQESAVQADARDYFGDLGGAIEAGRVPRSRLDDMARRILTSIFACGLADDPPGKGASDPGAAEDTARAIAEEGAVLLRNDGLLPLSTKLRRVLVVGGRADRGVPSGGGSSQVIPRGGVALKEREGKNQAMVFDPSPPLEALRRRLPSTVVDYDDGLDPERAGRKAGNADAVIVFVDQYLTEGADARNLTLPNGQDRLVERVAKADPRTVVVLETGGPVLMPWLDRTAAVLEAWYPGQKGGEAIADILVGVKDPSGRLPVTFPLNEAQPPRASVLNSERQASVPDSGPVIATRPQDASVGYRGFAERGQRSLFPFGYGLSYTTFRLGGLTARVEGATVTAAVDVTNTGGRAGVAVPQLYVTGPSGSRVGLRLAGWSRLDLAPGETRRVEIVVDPRLLAGFDEASRRWRIAPGSYMLSAAFDAGRRELATEIALGASDLPP